MPIVSIGMPVYNGQRFLGQTLDSLLSQTFRDFEIVISDNASTDDTEAICRYYAAREPRVRYFRNSTNLGAVKNYNRTFRLSSGTYFRWHGDDDLLEPTYLEKCVAVLDRDPSVVLCHSRTRLIDENGADLIFDPQSSTFTDCQQRVRIERPDPIYAQSDDAFTRFREALFSITVCQHALGLMRSAVLAKTGLFGSYYDADRALLVEIALHGKFHEVPEALFLKREHPRNSRSLASRKEKAQWASPGNLLFNLFPKVREHAQILSAILRSPLRWRDRAKCIGYGFKKAYVGRVREPAGAA